MLIIFIQFSECDVNDDWGLDLPLATIWVFVGFILYVALLIVLFLLTLSRKSENEMQASTKTQDKAYPPSYFSCVRIRLTGYFYKR